MLIDLTLKITPEMAFAAREREKQGLFGHLGTHFDVMDKEFPLEYTERKGIVFDASGFSCEEIELSDSDLEKIEKDMFVAFYTGFIDREEYGSAAYFSGHPQLSDNLIEKLLEKGISVIGIDFAGVRRGKEHTPKDQYCADRGVFIVENLCCLDKILENGSNFDAAIYPMNYIGTTGLPCRVIARL